MSRHVRFGAAFLSISGTRRRKSTGSVVAGRLRAMPLTRTFVELEKFSRSEQEIRAEDRTM
jgi:hypothetical protein